MTNASSSNAPPSDAALPTVPQKTRHYNTTDESEFLTQQAADAQAAMQRTVADIKAMAQEAANVRWWTQQYPWYALGAAAVLGFVVTVKALEPSDQHAPPPQAQATRPTWMSSLFEMVRSSVMSAIIGAIHSSGQQSSNGQHAERAQASTERF